MEEFLCGVQFLKAGLSLEQRKERLKQHLKSPHSGVISGLFTALSESVLCQ